MLSILKPTESEPPKRTEPHDIILIDSSDKTSAGSSPPPLAPEAPPVTLDTPARPASEAAAGRPVPAVDTTFRAAAAVDGRADDVAVDQLPVGVPLSDGPRPLRTAGRFLFAIALGGVATLAWQSYGDAGRRALAHWAPQLAPLLTPVTNAPAQPSAATTGAAAPNPAIPAVAPSAQPVAPTTAAAPSADVTQNLQSISQTLAAMARDIELLKAGQEQLKASQEQLTRELAKLTAQNLQRKPPTPLPRPAPTTATPAHKPAPLPPPPVAAAPPRPLAPPAPIRSAPSVPPPPVSGVTPPRPMP